MASAEGSSVPDPHTMAPRRPLQGPTEQLITDNLPLVGYLVAEVAGRLPSHVVLDDLRSAGFTALVQAARSYDEQRGVPFPKFASARIRGALIDELRSHDWASRSVRAKARQRDAIEDELAVLLGRRPTPDEVASRMGVTVGDVQSIDDDVHRAVVLSIQGFASDEAVDDLTVRHEASPEAELLTRERVAYLVDAVEVLPERLRQVITGLYFEERSITELAAQLEVTESRISQMRTEALGLLRDAVNSALDPDRVAPEERPGGTVARRRSAYFAAVAAQSTFQARLSRPSRRISGVA